MKPGRCIIYLSAIIAATAANGSIWIDLSNPSLTPDDQKLPAVSPLTLVHIVEDADIGQPRSTWTIPLIESTLVPYDRDALLWRHPLSGRMGYLSQPREIGVFMRVKGTDCDIRRLAGDTFEIRQSGRLFRYVDRVLSAASFNDESWRLEIHAGEGSVTAERVTKAGTQEFRFVRDRAGRLKEARGDAVEAILHYDCHGQLRRVDTGTAVWTFAYRDARLRTLALGENRRSCRWEHMQTGVRASSFSDVSQVRTPVVTLQPYTNGLAH